MLNPIGEMKTPAGERSQTSDTTNQLRTDLSSSGDVPYSYSHQGIPDPYAGKAAIAILTFAERSVQRC
ncbi:hypothetical protein CO662_31330 [Rhizobium anhuiense]|uniref:Uncharacterized protein n=1 Tax=Rhizobium anhuiense TaxID=1184720 RepID=A0ABX4IYX5_9HYPH|nr:hypothetical protein CO668_31525 [Rhizobium anhuiense]PDS48118.1 hypothetical protein CO662_31330 [Rhizobium anhuiense]